MGVSDAAKCQRNEAEHETAGDADISTSVAMLWPLGDEVKGSDNVWSCTKGSDNVWSCTSSYVFGKSKLPVV